MGRLVIWHCFSCQPASLKPARAALRASLPAGMASDQTGLIVLAAGEVWQNIIRHAARGGDPDRLFFFSLAWRGGLVRLLIFDNNPPALMPSAWPRHLPGPQGGFGHLWIDRLAISVSYRACAKGVAARLVFDPGRL